MVRMILDPSSKAKELITIAKSDLSIARMGKISPDMRYEELFSHCQQAVEKSFKTLITQYNIPYPADHSIENLIHYCDEKKIEIPIEIQSTSALIAAYESRGSAVSLSEYAAGRRYSLSENALTEQNYSEILVKTEKIVGWIEKQVL